MIRQGVEKIESLGSHAEGPRLVARAWTNPEFKNLLLSNAEAAVQQLLGISASNSTAPTVLTVVESTPLCHNLVVCTLCSCYPLSILGLSPAWYKSRIYRARAVREPRKMLADSFGLELPPQVSIHVHDSTADRRYMVLPLRPDGTEGWTEDDLCSIVTRDSMIGVAVPKATDDSSHRPPK
jgi:nitrile hydratase